MSVNSAHAPARRAVLAAATSLALSRGGMTVLDGHIVTLSAVVDRCGEDLGRRDPDLAAVIRAAVAVVDARLGGDEFRFSEAQDALRIALAPIWRRIAREQADKAAVA